MAFLLHDLHKPRCTSGPKMSTGEGGTGVLLADFHVHTKWSDGRMEMAEVVDLFGESGHDVIAITDHIVNGDSTIGKITHRFGLTVTRGNFAQYRDEIERQRKRAWDEYRMIVLAGAELTQNAYTRRNSAHVLALGIEEFVPADGTVEEMLVRARASAKVVVACHPHEQSDWFSNTFYLWNRREEVGDLIDRWEIACRWDLFPPVARARFAFMGNSDFHDRPHLYAWKTLLSCDKTEEGIVRALTGGKAVGLTRLSPPALPQELSLQPAYAR